MTASMEIVTSEKKDILLAPSDAVFSEGGQTYVTTPAGRTVYVTTGIADEDDVEIVSGLEEGDRVMTRERAASDQRSLPLAGRVAHRASVQANLP
jgi:multidrug efflux pump subunit AcrA (membrane-fusion protein)